MPRFRFLRHRGAFSPDNQSRFRHVRRNRPPKAPAHGRECYAPPRRFPRMQSPPPNGWCQDQYLPPLNRYAAAVSLRVHGFAVISCGPCFQAFAPRHKGFLRFRNIAQPQGFLRQHLPIGRQKARRHGRRCFYGKCVQQVIQLFQ